MIPLFKVKIDVFVEGFDEIQVEDLVTLKISVERLNLDDKQEIGVAHSNNFPDIYDEKVVILITADNKINYEATVKFIINLAKHF